MSNIRSRRTSLRVVLGASLLLSTIGCHVHTHRVGMGPTMPEGVGVESARQLYMFFGLIRLNEVNVQRMSADLTSYEIRSEVTLTDLLLMPVLFPLTITSRTVSVQR